MTEWAQVIKNGWVATGAVPGPGIDEFAAAGEVVAALAGPRGAGDTLLAVQHPHRTPEARARGLSLTDALPLARRALDRLRTTAYRRVTDFVAPYRVDGPDGTAIGVLCLVDPAAVDGHGMSRVRHSEQVYPQVVAERAAMLAGLGCATSAAMLVPVSGGEGLTATVQRIVGALGAPAVSTTDAAGRTHRLWLLGPGTDQDTLLTEVRRHPLVVADGNHRLAATVRASSNLLALITAGPALRIGSIHRVLTGTGLTAADLVQAWQRAGLNVRTIDEPATPAEPGGVTVRTPAANLRVDLPAPGPGEPLPRIDHALVEQLLIGDALGIDPQGPHVHPLPAGHATDQEADAVLQLAPVPFADVLAVHRQGRRMPRKSTYFTPKPQSGLLLADLTG
ncbi:DUF1015 family protein [Amycolatopsis anabasis]|uniref:DUF1015 family protein n=1 Tax=Amycolatopsis anabasis TaxID=1840409 RepID=UPI00131C3743|nr:DUF1015 family protein [Amycolatopsis anabasis]